MGGTEARNPYIGPRPFGRGDALLFFGRDQEVDELLSLAIANRAVVLCAASGVGKTSLLNAALVPALEREGFEVLPVARVHEGLAFASPASPAANVYVSGLLSHLGWESRPGAEILAPASLAPHGESAPTIGGFLAALERQIDTDGLPAPRALLIDQLEELFVLHPERWQDREGFFEQLAEGLEEDPSLRIVLSLREDYLAQLDRYLPLLPGRPGVRLRLEALGIDAALQAVTGPLRGTQSSFAPAAANMLVNNLRKIHVQSPQGTTVTALGEFIEPSQLQVVCRGLLARLPSGVHEIGVEQVRLVSAIDEELSRFYDEAITAAATSVRTSEKDLRARFEAAFITPAGTRGSAYRGVTSTAGLPNEAVDEFQHRHLIRGDFRAGAQWYELTNDRLIEPVRASNRRYSVSEPADALRGARAAAASVRLVRRIARGFGLGRRRVRED
jgi:hypothetical protein